MNVDNLLINTAIEILKNSEIPPRYHTVQDERSRNYMYTYIEVVVGGKICTIEQDETNRVIAIKIGDE